METIHFLHLTSDFASKIYHYRTIEFKIYMLIDYRQVCKFSSESYAFVT
jgi:hypothetical protein